MIVMRSRYGAIPVGFVNRMVLSPAFRNIGTIVFEGMLKLLPPIFTAVSPPPLA